MTNIWAKMPYHSYLFSGQDSKAFLQGQLTQDIDHITQNTCHYGAYCNHQGRMLANTLLSAQEEGIIVRLHQRQAQSTIERFKMFILRSKVAIDLLPDTHLALNQTMAESFCRHVGAVLPKAFTAVQDSGYHLLALPSGYFELRTTDAQLLTWIEQHGQADFAAIEQLRIAGANFHILPETNALILPQQTPLETWGGISYNKGCYVGQEIIARNKYRGTVKKGLATAHLTSAPDVALASPIYNDKRNVGEVIEYHQGVCLALLLLSAENLACELNNIPTTFTLIK